MIKRTFLFMGLALGMALTGCGNASTSAQSPTSANAGNAGAQSPGSEYVAQDAKGIQTMTVHKTAIPEYLDLAAHIEPDPTRVVHVFAPAGGRITELRVRPWDRVEKGQTLAELESSDLARAVADYHKALADNQVKQKRTGARAGPARSQGHFRARIPAGAGRRAAGRRRKWKRHASRSRYSGWTRTTRRRNLLVKAPRSGVILDVGAAPGEFSQALSASAPLCTVADITTVWAVGDIYEKDLAAAKSGEPAQVTLERVSRRSNGRGASAWSRQRWIRRRGRCMCAWCCRMRTCELSRQCSDRSGWCGRPRRGFWCRQRR